MFISTVHRVLDRYRAARSGSLRKRERQLAKLHLLTGRQWAMLGVLYLIAMAITTAMNLALLSWLPPLPAIIAIVIATVLVVRIGTPPLLALAVRWARRNQE